MKEKYFISVVVGTYSNRNEVLDKYALQSVLSSAYPKDAFEIIVVDNNAGEDVHNDLMRRYADNPLIKIAREDRQGICFVRNKGVESAGGDIISFIDDDCEVDLLWLKRINEFYQDPSIMFGGGSIYDTALNRKLRASKHDPLWPEERRIPGGNMSFRNRLFEKFKFDENIIYGKDEFELIFRLLKEGYAWYFDEKPISHHRSPSQYRDGNLQVNKKGETLSEDAELYFEFKRKMYARIYPGTEPDWQKKERTKAFIKYFFISKKKYSLALKALEKIVRDINLLRL